MFKKGMYLGNMAVVALALMAPGIAAAEWTHGGAGLKSSTKVSLAGTQAFTSSIGGASCTKVSEEVTLIPGNEGEGSMSVEPSSCTTSGGLAGCKITSVTPTLQPYNWSTNGTTVTLNGRRFDVTMHGAFCPFHVITVEGSFCYAPDASGTFGPFTIIGNHTVNNGTTGAFIANATLSGKMNASPNETYEF